MDLIVLGLDGIAPEYLETAIEERDLQNLEELKEQSFYSELPSTIPAVTVPAWQVAFTGLDPGKLGIYHMVQYDYGNREVNAPDSNQFYGKFFWDRMEKKTLAHNVPGTYPSYPMNGSMKSGFPAKDEYDIYPQELAEKIDENVDEQEPSRDRTTASSKIGTEFSNYEKEEQILDLMMEEEHDIAVSVVKMTDNVSHYSESEDQLLDAYEKVDERVGKMKKLAEEEDIPMIALSDHGFNEYHRKFNVVNFLRENSWLELEANDSSSSFLYDLVNPLMDTPVKKYLKYVHDYFSSATGKDLTGRASLVDSIDVEKTEVFPVFASDKDLGLKTDIKLEKVEKALLEYEYDGEKVVEEVFHGDEIYSENSENPDLVVRMNDGYLASASTSKKTVSKTRTFAHDINGIFMAYNALEDKIEPDMYDIAPLIYLLVDEEVPDDVRETVGSKRLGELKNIITSKR